MTNLEIYKKIKEFTLCSMERTYSTIDSVRYIINKNIPGNFIECGVARGGQIMAMLMTLNDLKAERDVYLYDTFEGIPEPEEWEVKSLSKKKIKPKAIDKFNLLKRSDGTSGWVRHEIYEVKKNVFSIPYNRDKLYFVKGLVEETLPESRHEKIALLRLDTDLYSSTKVEMEYCMLK